MALVNIDFTEYLRVIANIYDCINRVGFCYHTDLQGLHNFKKKEYVF